MIVTVRPHATFLLSRPATSLSPRSRADVPTVASVTGRLTRIDFAPPVPGWWSGVTETKHCCSLDCSCETTRMRGREPRGGVGIFGADACRFAPQAGRLPHHRAPRAVHRVAAARTPACAARAPPVGTLRLAGLSAAAATPARAAARGRETPGGGPPVLELGQGLQWGRSTPRWAGAGRTAGRLPRRQRPGRAGKVAVRHLCARSAVLADFYFVFRAFYFLISKYNHIYMGFLPFYGT